jgi:hypothetical protein
MPDILVSIDCGEVQCEGCVGFDEPRSHCNIFCEWIEDGERCADCREAEDQANMLTEDFEEDD